MSWPWSQLGLPGPSDLSEVRHAYAEKLKTTHPEDDPEGFQRLHSAYQLASRLARQQKRPKRPFPQAEDTPASHSGSGMREDDIMEIEVPPEDPPREEQDFDFDQLLQEGGEHPRRTGEDKEQDFDFDQLLQEGGEHPRHTGEDKEQDFDFDQLLQEGGEHPRRTGEDKEQDFDFDQLLQAQDEPLQKPQEAEEEERDFDFDRLFAEGEAERAEARRRRGEERRRAQAQAQAWARERQKAQEWTWKRERWQRQEQRGAYERERRDRFDQEQFRWQNTETVLHTIEMLHSAQAGREAWEKFLQSELFLRTRDSLDLIFGLEDFVSTRNLSQEARLALFLAYGFDKGPSRPELRPLYQMLLGAWQAVQAKKKRQRLWNILAIPIALVLIYVAAVILASPLLIVFIALGLVAVHGLNKGWLKRRPKSLAPGQRSSIYVLCALAGCAVAAVFLLPGLLGGIQDRMPTSDPREQVCRYLEQDFGMEVRSLYDENAQNERFSNVFALKIAADHMFLAGPDGERDKKEDKQGYTTNLPDMMVLWALEDFAQSQEVSGIDTVNRNQGMEPWETSGTYLYTLPFWGAGEKITALGEFLEELAGKSWYQEQPPRFEIVLCGEQMKEGRLIISRWKPEDGAFDAQGVRELYEESFAHAYCAQLLKECELDRDFVHDGTERYELSAGEMEEMCGETCFKLYGLGAEGTAEMEYYVNQTLTNIYCVPGSFWAQGGTQEQMDFYKIIYLDESDRVITVRYPWIRVN